MSSQRKDRGVTRFVALLYLLALIPFVGSARAQFVRIPLPFQVNCSNGVAKLNAGDLYQNTCSITGGESPYFLSTGPLPVGLSTTKTGTSVTISGRPGVGHFQYTISFGSGSFETAIGLYTLDVSPAPVTGSTGTTTYSCVQRGSAGSAQSPLCQTCVLSAGSRVCDRDDAGNPTNLHPAVPTNAHVTSVYLEQAPVTSNVASYVLTLKHPSQSGVQVLRQVAYQLAGQAAKFATKAVPVPDFNGQFVGSNGGQWGFNFQPVMINSSPGAEWGLLKFQWDADWSVSTIGSLKSGGSSSADLDARETTGVDQRAFRLSETSSSRLGITAGWNAITVATLKGLSLPAVLLQNEWNGSIEAWTMSGTDISKKLTLPVVPLFSLRLAGAADMDGDGEPDLIFQDSWSGAIELWKLSGWTVVKKVVLPGAPNKGLIVKGVIKPLKDKPAQIVLQDQKTLALTLWDVQNLQVTATSQVQKIPASGWSEVVVADVNGDQQDDLVLQNPKTYQLQLWQVVDHQVASESALTLSTSQGSMAVAGGALRPNEEGGVFFQDAGGSVTYVGLADR